MGRHNESSDKLCQEDIRCLSHIQVCSLVVILQTLVDRSKQPHHLIPCNCCSIHMGMDDMGFESLVAQVEVVLEVKN